MNKINLEKLIYLSKKCFFKLFFNPIYLHTKYLFLELHHPQKTILLKATSYPNNAQFIPQFKCNIGDDINYILAPLIFNKYVIPYQYSIIGRWLYQKDNILLIGSIITGLSTKKSIVLGTGLSPDQTSKPITPPKEIKCVRGPLTQKYLQQHNIECPSIYGDPALILPLFYTPKHLKKYQIGFIPHFLDKNVQTLTLLSRYKDQNCIVLDVNKYKNWKDFLDQLCSCEIIFSSSLHGLIFADTYNIPNIWTHFSYKVNPFKYKDYFLSVGRKEKKPFLLTSYISIERLFLLKNQWKEINYDREQLLVYLRSSIKN